MTDAPEVLTQAKQAVEQTTAKLWKWLTGGSVLAIVVLLLAAWWLWGKIGALRAEKLELSTLAETAQKAASDSAAALKEAQEKIEALGKPSKGAVAASSSPEVQSVPETSAAPAPGYVVQRGDSLGQIALDALGNAKWAGELARLNGIEDPDVIVEGQVIRLPERK